MGYFPNVALYLDDQSMQFPSRNADIYMADMERVEVLEGPQGTLFGGGAEAGAVRYITNKPNLDKFEGHSRGQRGGTVGGAPNGAFNATINVPVIQDKLAIRAVVYDERRGGYIDNVPSTFTRSERDTATTTSDPQPMARAPTTCQPQAPRVLASRRSQLNNASIAQKNSEPDHLPGRPHLGPLRHRPGLERADPESFQDLDAEGPVR